MGSLRNIGAINCIEKVNHFQKIYMVAHLELPPNIKCKWVLNLLIITQSLLYIIYTHYQLHI